MDRLTTRLFLFLVAMEPFTVVLPSQVNFFSFMLTITVLLPALAYQIKLSLIKPKKEINRVGEKI